MAIQMLQGPIKGVDVNAMGRFSLPPGFNHKKWAAQWTAERDVEMHKEREHLLGIAATADGWIIYTGEDGKQKPCKVDAGKEGKFTLMVRPKIIQQQVNQLYGNLGKQLARQEQQGELVAGAGQQDPGMMPYNQMRRAGLDNEELETSEVQLSPTPIPSISQENLTAETVT